MAVDAWELAAWDATETAERIARGDVTPLEVIDAAIQRAEDARGLNAIVTQCFDAARAVSTRPIAPSTLASPARALAGVPFFVKDLASIAGVRTAWGSGATGTFIAKKSDATVRLFEDMGLVALGKSATPEYGLTATTEPLGFLPASPPIRASEKRSSVPSTLIRSARMRSVGAKPWIPASAMNSSASPSVSRMLGSKP